MKRIIVILCTLCLLALLAGCGAEQSVPETAGPAQTAEPAAPAAQETAPEEAAQEPAQPEAPSETEEAPAQPETPAGTEPAAPEGLELALSLTGQETAGLLDALGEPLSQSYEASCSGPGDDGIWQYDGFIVFTYRENGTETIVDAEAD